MMDEYTQLAFAIIDLAACDYRAAKTGVVVDTKNAIPYYNPTSERVIQDCEQFFNGSWFGVLSMSAVSGDEMLTRLDESIKAGWKKPQGRHRLGVYRG